MLKSIFIVGIGNFIGGVIRYIISTLMNGKLFDARFDPVNPPEYVKCFGMMKLGRKYLLTTSQLTIVEGENHRISRRTRQVATLVTQFFKQH